ncbi:MAG: hypothetical protein QMB22_00880 [Dehalococcoidia bacterium]|jgi:hypothetical protein|nr:MAG: hypothetical protein DK305_001024 [Chloroflexota bacterium]|tara:strand:+ start:11513 stop:11710 length:198 start_codon:yes stop_codon:yes gene_type:complete
MTNIPVYVLVARIISVIGMSFAITLGLLLLIAGYFIESIIAFGFTFPSITIMAFLEKKADINWRK